MTKEDQDEYLNLVESIVYKKSGRPVPLSHHPLYEKIMNESTWAKFVFLSALYPNLLDLDANGQRTAFQIAMLSAFGSLLVDDYTKSYRSYYDDPDCQEAEEPQPSMEEHCKQCWALRDENILRSQEKMPVVNQEHSQISMWALETARGDRERYMYQETVFRYRAIAIRDREVAVIAREAAVAARESAVERREAALVVRESRAAAHDRD
ncbi:hypothetical protein GGI42DRAFT_332706 [Trichoderma sp. SZMC 28013]